jgi:hypothetical protein
MDEALTTAAEVPATKWRRLMRVMDTENPPCNSALDWIDDGIGKVGRIVGHRVTRVNQRRHTPKVQGVASHKALGTFAGNHGQI